MLAGAAFMIAGAPKGLAHKSPLDPQFMRQVVSDPTGEVPGTIVISTGEFFLHLVLQDGAALRYGVGVGRDGFAWTGATVVGRKAEWPIWTPPPSMIRREPRARQVARWNARRA